MRFSGFDADTNRLLFDAYDEAMASLSSDSALSLDLIYRNPVILEARGAEEKQIEPRQVRKAGSNP